MKTVAPSVSRYFGAKPSQSRSPLPANTNATSNSAVFRRSPRKSARLRQPLMSQCRSKQSVGGRFLGVLRPKISWCGRHRSYRSLVVDVRVSRGSNFRLEVEPAAAFAMRVERGFNKCHAPRAILD